MGAFAAWIRRRKSLVTAVVIAVLAGVPLSLAIFHQGFPVTEVDLKAQNVWVTNGEKLLGGRLNHQIGELDAKVNGSSSHLDVLQDGGATLLTDTSQGSVQMIDPSFVSLTDKITVPVGSQLSYGLDTLAILSADGKLWVLDASQHLTFDAAKTAPVAKLGADAQVVVTKSGRVFAVSPSLKKLFAVDRPNSTPSQADFPRLKNFQLSAVGDHPVVLDRKANTLVKQDGSTTALPAKGIRIQQAGPDNSYVLVATGKSLLQVPLGGGDVTAVQAGIKQTITGTADVSAPVFLNGCAYGAWAAAQKYLYACDGKPPKPQDIGEPTSGSDLEFRVNHGVIALNNLQNGNAWIVSSNIRLVNNWAQINPDEVTKDGDTGKEKPVKQAFVDALANRTKTNHVPVAVDDSFGARPGRTTVLPVLDNDTDEDGDILTITKVEGIDSSQGVVDVIEGGRALQYTAPAGDISSASFRYTVSDGRGGLGSAQVNVGIRPLSANLPPVAARSSASTVEVGQSIEYNVLGDWRDPDGDDIYLVGAAPTTPDSVQFTPDGRITFTSKTGQTGAKKVTFTVSDGHATATGSLDVDVKPVGSLDPVAVPDFSTAVSSTPIVINPLDNDLSPSGAPLSLVDAKVSTGGAANVSADQSKSTISFQANTPGPYYLSYTLAAGSHQTEGLILVNVSDPSSSQLPPIAVKDNIYVRPGEPTTVSVLDNDVSPSGRVLVLQSVASGPDASALNVEVLANSVVRVTAPGVLSQQVQLTYTVSDGVKSATAGITVVPIPPLVNHQAPVAEDDTVTVRAGDIASVHVLANDHSPDNEPFVLDPTLVDSTNAGTGATAFISNSLVRYQAPTTPGTYSVTYGISDKFKQQANATVTFLVTARGGKNRPPELGTLTARAFAGAKVEVVVPLDGLDPDGDSVSLDGIETPPTLGRITNTTPTSFTYQAYANSAGTDTFTYRVQDTAGKTAIGSINVGVIPRPSTVKPPTAVDDRIEVKPGKTASVPVLLNDSDPNGYTVSLLPKLPEVQEPLKAKVAGATVLVTAPGNEGAYVIRYQITNGQGGSATAFIQVIVTNDAKPTYPSAADHIIDIQDLTGKDTISVDALSGALNPSGLVTDLKVGVKGPNAGAANVAATGGKIVVTPGEHRMAITYSLTDETTGLAGEAFIVVPPKPGSAEASTAPPRIKPGYTPVITMNGTQTFTLSQILDVPSGRPVKMTGASGTSATNSATGSPFVDAQTLTFTGAKGYRGAAAITFRVDDGRDAGTTSDRITLLTLPITVGNPDQSDVAPTFTPPNIQVEAGEAAQVVDLRASTYHPNPTALSQVTYDGFSGSTKDVVATPSGSQLSISSPLGVQPGTTVTIKFTVKYQNFTIPGSVNVRVVSSSRPLAQQKNAPQTAEFKRNTAGGKTFSNAVSDQYWINPFPETPLVILDATAAAAPAGVTVSHTASAITVTAGTAAKTGNVNITYTVQDGTKDKTRNVTGQLNVTIHDVPEAPPAPSNVKATDGQATMTISAPTDSHGLPVTGYTITSSPASQSGTMTSTGTYTAGGLTNGTAYRFTVIASNSDGPSSASPASAAVTPYGKPGPPTSVNLRNTGGDAPTTLRMTWGSPDNTGGGTAEYRYNFNSGGWSGWSGTRSVDMNVNKGTYSFQVQARNPGNIESDVVTSNSVSVKDPDPSVSLQKGTYTTQTCSFGCYTYRTSVTGFTPGTYRIVYYCQGQPLSSFPHTITVGADGKATHDSNDDGSDPSRCGYDNASVTVNGVSSGSVDFRP
ncbi:Ig-like domain-containing protein [Glaciihabitans sp. UYNi722]|uniref:Ig-like domain-containing protein n=1 Tax=Glaciihabitans sp. UYNi722 TaxID=3156344 RepID=UPI0033996B0F